MTPAGLTVKKIAIFVDVQNIYYTTRQSYGRQFDYRKLMKRIRIERPFTVVGLAFLLGFILGRLSRT